jgi:hypothetical protein
MGFGAFVMFKRREAAYVLPLAVEQRDALPVRLRRQPLFRLLLPG